MSRYPFKKKLKRANMNKTYRFIEKMTFREKKTFRVKIILVL